MILKDFIATYFEENDKDYFWYKSLLNKIENLDSEDNERCILFLMFQLFEYQNDDFLHELTIISVSNYFIKFTDETEEINFVWTVIYNNGDTKIRTISLQY